jgi:hypothetical protein
METAEKAALSDPSYLRQRGRSIAMLKEEWLKRPPFALEQQTRQYIERISEAKACPVIIAANEEMCGCLRAAVPRNVWFARLAVN